MTLLTKLLAVTILINYSVCSLWGQDVAIRVEAPPTARVGDNFIIKYAINRNTDKITLNEFSSDFKLNYGPSISASNSMSMTNGVVTRTSETIFRYSVEALKEGKIAIPIATIIADSVKCFSNAAFIEVVAKDSSSSVALNDGHHFAELTFSAKNAFKHEPIEVQLKVYSTSNLQSIVKLNMPKFDDFLQYDITPNQVELAKETINGVEYNSVVINKKVLIPIKTGPIHVEKTNVVCVAKTPLPKKNHTPFDDFFESSTTENVTFQADSTSILIHEFPSDLPSDFKNISGRDIKITSTIVDSLISPNNPFELKMEIAGNADLRFLNDIDVKLPKSLKLIGKESSIGLSLDNKAIYSYKTFSFKIKATTSGVFEIPGVSVSYFDLESKKYHNILSQAISVNVQKNESATPINNKLNQRIAGNSQKTKIKSATMIVVDLSATMRARDFTPDRKTAVINELMKFVGNTDREIGVVVYSSVPCLINPISKDKRSIVDSLKITDSLKLGDATATGMAIVMAVDELNKYNSKNKSIVLVTDGMSNTGSINVNLAVELAKCFNIQTNIIGVSSKADNAPITIETKFGNKETTVPIDINDQEYTLLAKSMNGDYYRVTNMTELENAFIQIDKSKNTKPTINPKPNYSCDELQSLIDIVHQEVLEKSNEIQDTIKK